MRKNYKVITSILDFYFITLILFYFLFNYTLFPLNLVPPMDLPIGDGQAIIALKNCPYSLNELYMGINSCDPYNRPFNYPHLVYYLSKIFLIFPYRMYLILGSTLYLIGVKKFIKIISENFKLFNSSYLLNFFQISFLFNYPLMLCIERGNYELFIISLFLYSNIELFNPNRRKQFFAIFLLTFGGLLKLYPVFSLIGINLYNIFFNKLISLKKIIKNLLLPFFIVLTITPSLKYIISNTPKTQGGLGFGFLCIYQDELGKYSFLFLVIKLIIIFLIAVFSRLSFHQLKEKIKRNSVINRIFVLNAFSFICIYFLSRSYDYRLSFFIPLLPLTLYFIENIHFKIKYINFKLDYSVIFITLFTMIFFIDGYLALASWPPSTMNIFAAIFRVITDFFIQPIFIGLILNILYSIFKELIALKEPKLKLFN